MAVLDSCPKHNMVAYLEKSEGNAEFHEILDFLKRSTIHHALTVSPVVSTTFVEQFWTSAKSKIINNVRHILVQKDPLFDEIPEDIVDHMETENAQDEGRIRDIVDEDKEIEENILSTEDVLSTNKDGVSTDMEKVSTDRPIVSIDGSKVSTYRQNEGTKEQNEGIEEEIATQATQTSIQTPTSKTFSDDETIAKVLLNMSQAKAVSREETDRPRPTSIRSLLTLKPLPKINPKDKG
ncbi:hypothetical protein Tco_0136969, partial [Tanacetum coccineum]